MKRDAKVLKVYGWCVEGKERVEYADGKVYEKRKKITRVAEKNR
jgi:hypothetical protein